MALVTMLNNCNVRAVHMETMAVELAHCAVIAQMVTIREKMPVSIIWNALFLCCCSKWISKLTPKAFVARAKEYICYVCPLYMAPFPVIFCIE